MSRTRRLAVAFGALLGLVVLAMGALVATFDAERTTQWAVDWMRTQHRRALAVEGPVALTVFPRLAVAAKELRLSEAGRDDEFLHADDVRLSARLLPLLRGRVVVDGIQVRGLRAVWRRDAQGRSNVDDLFGPTTGFQPSGAAPPEAPAAAAFDIGRVQVEDLVLSFDDQRGRMGGQLKLQALDLGGLAGGKAAPLSWKARVTLSAPRPAALDLEGQARLRIGPAPNAIALDGMHVALRGDAAGWQGVSATLDGELAWDGQAASAQDLRLALDGGRGPGLTLAASSVRAQQLVFDPEGQKLALKALQIALAGRGSEQQQGELSLRAPQLVVDRQGVSGEPFQGSLALAGPLAIKGQLQTGAPAGRFEALRLPAVRLTLDGRAGARQVALRAQGELLLDLSQRQATLDPLAIEGTIDEPGHPRLPLELRGQAQAGAGSARWRIEGSLGDNRFDTSGRADFAAGAVPRVRAQARCDRLDLDALLPAPAAASAPRAAAPTPRPLEALDALDGEASVSVGQFVLHKVRVTDLRLQAALAQGTLRVSQLSGRAWGGSVQASGSAHSQGQRLALDVDASGVDIRALLHDIAGKEPLEGTGRLTARLQSQGGDLGALRSHLAGSAAVQLRDGAIRGVDLAGLLRQAKAALAMKSDSAGRASATQKTDFAELRATARIAAGVAESDDLDLRSPYLRLGGAGRADIGRGTLDYTARATVVDAGKGLGMAELSALRGVVVPVRLHGPFEAVDWEIQWSRVATGALQKELEKQLSRDLGARIAPPAGAASAPSPRDLLKRQLDEKLKGLLR